MEKKVRDIVKPKTKGKSIVVAFGRFQPPTSGHQLLVDKVISTAKSLGAEYAMFSSRTNDPKKNPLTPRQKFKYLKRFFPDANFKDLNTIKNPVEMLYWLAEKGYDHVHLVGGEDRQGQYEAFKDLMSSTRRKDRLKLKSLTIVGAGKRDENATGVQGMSASKLRAAAAANDFKTFKSGMPRQANSSDVKDLYQDLQRGMKTVIKEGINYTDIYRTAAERLLESDKKKRRADTPGQTGGFSKHNKIFPTPPCKMDEDLSQWFKEKWVDIGGKKDPKTGEYPPCGRSDTSKGKYPKCRPVNKVNSKTPETVGEMTPKERKRAVIQKRRVEPETQQSGKGNAPRMTSHLKSSK